MKTVVLQPAGSSGFVFEKGESFAIVDMGTPPSQSFWEALDHYAAPPESVDVLALTHLHGDHVCVEGLDRLLEHSQCLFLVPQLCWKARGQNCPQLAALDRRIEHSGRLHLLAPAGWRSFRGWQVGWTPTTHEVGGRIVLGGNLAYRFGGVIISGDGPVRDLFAPRNQRFLGLCAGGIPVCTLILNLAQLDRDDLAAQSDLSLARRRRYEREHGLVADLVLAMHAPVYRSFFRQLQTLIPTHVRRRPIEESIDIFRKIIEAERDALGYSFNVRLQTLTAKCEAPAPRSACRPSQDESAAR